MHSSALWWCCYAPTEHTALETPFYWKFCLKRQQNQKTFQTTAIYTGSTDTLRITILKTREAKDQANKKIASSKWFLLHLLLHACTKKKTKKRKPHKYLFSHSFLAPSLNNLSSLEVCICLILVEPCFVFFFSPHFSFIRFTGGRSGGRGFCVTPSSL